MTDALSISTKSDEGAASVLGRGNQMEMGKLILAERMRELKEKQAKEAELKSLLNEDVEAKWTSDAVNYFTPKLDEIKNNAVKLYAEKQGKLSDIDIFNLKRDIGKLKQEALNSNALYAEEQDRMKALKQDPQYEKYDPDSWTLRSEWNNPWETRKDEIEAAGGIIPWRMKHSQAYENVGKYSLEEHLAKALKDKQSEWWVRDDKGKIKTYTDPSTGLIVMEGRKGVDPEKLEGHISTIWNDPKDWYAGKMRKFGYDWVNSNFNITENGIEPLSKEALTVVSAAPATKGLKPEQIKQVLAKQFVVETAKNRFPATEMIKTEKPINIDVGLGGPKGGVSGITSQTENAVPGTNSPLQDPAQTGPQFTTVPFKVTAAFGPDQIDPETGEAIADKKTRPITYGQLKLKPRAQQDMILRVPDAKGNITEHRIKKGHFFTDQEMMIADKNKENAKYIHWGVYAQGYYDLKGEGINIENLDVNELGKTIKSVITPAETVVQAGQDAVSEKEKAVFMKNYNELKNMAKLRNGYSTDRTKKR